MLNKNYQPKLSKSTKNMSVSEWEQERKNSLGGSDMAILLGLNHFGKTKRDLYYDKKNINSTNEQKDKYQDIIFNSGHFLEETVANLFSYRTGLESYEIKAMFEHPLHPHIRGNIDRFYRYRGTNTPLGFLECKTTSEYNKRWSNDRIPTDYIVQIITYLSILNMNHCKIACLFIPELVRVISGILFQMKNCFETLPKQVVSDLKDQLMSINDEEIKLYVPMLIKAIGGEFCIPKHLMESCSETIGDKFQLRDFERDEQLEEQILCAADDFWFNYVQKGVEPSLEGENGEAAISTLEKYTVAKTSVKPKVLPDTLTANLKQIQLLKEQKTDLRKSVDNLDKEITKLSVPIIEALDGFDKGVISDGNADKHLVTYTQGTPSVSVPKAKLELLKNSFPQAYAECTTTTQRKPTLKVKELKDSD